MNRARATLPEGALSYIRDYSGTSVSRDPCGLYHLEEIIPAKSTVPYSSIAHPSEDIPTCLTCFCFLSTPYILHPALQSLQESTGDESLGKTVELYFLRFVLGKHLEFSCPAHPSVLQMCKYNLECACSDTQGPQRSAEHPKRVAPWAGHDCNLVRRNPAFFRASKKEKLMSQQWDREHTGPRLTPAKVMG